MKIVGNSNFSDKLKMIIRRYIKKSGIGYHGYYGHHARVPGCKPNNGFITVVSSFIARRRIEKIGQE